MGEEGRWRRGKMGETPPLSPQNNEPLLEFLSCLATASFQEQSTAQALICLRTELEGLSYYT